ncbi:MAG TPA: GNAT family N-acetyltransferase [Mycobacterium sp.]|nr:GNAT family N-acetyltransferase [Mycobacterium sp.]
MGAPTSVEADELARLELFAGVAGDDLAALASELTPMWAAPGDVFMRQGDPALSFLIIAAGRAEVRHTGPDGVTMVVGEVSPGMIVGEIALLRHTARTRTVIATERLYAFKGRRQAFETMLDIPDLADRLVRTARQRLAADITPVPVRARDGTELLLRPVLPGDAERIANGPVWFSPDTLYRRFLSTRTLSPPLLKYLTEVDYVDHFVWVVTDGIDGPVIADARFVRDHNDPALAEIAFTVADAYQGRGIGTLLADALAVAARLDGVTRFVATVLADNAPARALLERLNVHWEPEGPGVLTATVDVPEPTHLPPNTVRAVRDMARQVIYAFD